LSQPAYQPTKPSPYAGTWQDRTGHELPTATQQRRVRAAVLRRRPPLQRRVGDLPRRRRFVARGEGL